MKKILVSMFAVAALAACTTEQTIVAPQGEAITFDTFVENSTRADITTSNLAEFGVYASIQNTNGAALLLTNERVYNNDGWKYDKIQYWVPNANYEFTAFAPYAGAHWTYAPATTADNGVVTFKNEAAEANQDFIFAAADKDLTDTAELDSNPGTVGFTFAHQLSKITFKFANTFTAANNIELRVYNVNVEGLVSEANATIAKGVAGEWAAVDNDTPFSRTFGTQVAANAENTATIIAAGGNYTTDSHYFIPVAGTEYTIAFDVDIIQAGVLIDTYHHTGLKVTPALTKGGNFMFNTTLNAENVSDDPTKQLYPIEFTVNKVEDWRDNGSVAFTEPTEVDTADELATAVAKGGNIRLANGLTLSSEELYVAAGKEVNVDLNGCTLTIDGAATTPATGIDPISNYGKMTISNGTIVSANAEVYRRCIFNQEGGEMVINNVEFVQQYDKAGAAINNKGKMTINNATVDAVRYAVWSSGLKAETIINSGTFSNETDKNLPVYAVVAYDGAKMTINGGTFISDHGCVCACGGSQVLVNGGTFTCTSEYNAGSDWVFAAGDGSNPMNPDDSRINYDESECVINGNIFNNGCVVAF